MGRQKLNKTIEDFSPETRPWPIEQIISEGDCEKKIVFGLSKCHLNMFRDLMTDKQTTVLLERGSVGINNESNI